MIKLGQIFLGLTFALLSLLAYAETNCDSLATDEKRVCQKIEDSLSAKQQALLNSYNQALDKAAAESQQYLNQVPNPNNYPVISPSVQLQQNRLTQPSTSYAPQNGSQQQNASHPASNSVNIFN